MAQTDGRIARKGGSGQANVLFALWTPHRLVIRGPIGAHEARRGARRGFQSLHFATRVRLPGSRFLIKVTMGRRDARSPMWCGRGGTRCPRDARESVRVEVIPIYEVVLAAVAQTGRALTDYSHI